MGKYFLIFSLLFFGITGVAYAADCPFGISHDPAPGQCGLYVDRNGDSLCDLGEDKKTVAPTKQNNYLSEEELKKLNVGQVADFFEINAEEYRKEIGAFLKREVRITDSLGVLHDQYGLCSGVAAGMAAQLKNSGSAGASQASKASSAIAPAVETKPAPKYKLVLILIFTLIFYFISHLLVEAKRISILTHRRAWNLILLLSFLVSAIFGIMLVLAINFGWFIGIYAFILYWHVEFGTVMAIVTIFHIAWHWPYFAAMIKKRPKNLE
jgi:hypothetical protein